MQKQHFLTWPTAFKVAAKGDLCPLPGLTLGLPQIQSALLHRAYGILPAYTIFYLVSFVLTSFLYS